MIIATEGRDSQENNTHSGGEKHLQQHWGQGYAALQLITGRCNASRCLAS